MMFLVVDVNVVFSALHCRGVAYEVFAMNRICKKFSFTAPEYMFLELDSNYSVLAERSRLSERELSDMLGFLKTETADNSFSEEFGVHVPKAFEMLSKHQKDAPYLALALYLGCPIFSGDKKLKKLSPVKVYSPAELRDMLKTGADSF